MIPEAVAQLADELAGLAGVVAVVLGGSRAAGTARPDSDWDLGVYYRATRPVDPADVRALGHPGHVSELGEWGPIVNGGGWLTVGGLPVDVLFRDYDRVLRWLGDAEHGRFDVLAQNGHLVGAPTYLPVGELSMCEPLAGRVLRPVFPEPLAAAAPERWNARASLSLLFADGHARRGDPVGCAGQLAAAVLCAAHARLAARREWTLTEKGLAERAGLAAVQERLAAVGRTGAELAAAVADVSATLGVAALRPRQRP